MELLATSGDKDGGGSGDFEHGLYWRELMA